MTIHPKSAAHSTLQPYSEEEWTDPGMAAVVAAYQRGNQRALVYDAKDADLIRAGLTTLSNTEDEIAEDKYSRDVERKGFARRACVALSRLGARV